MDRARLASSVKHLDVGIRTSWTSDRFRTLEFLYLLSLEASVTDYRWFVLVTVAELVLAVIGGPIVELVVPQFVHWVHSTAALLVIFGLYDPVTNDMRTTEWARVLLSEPSQIRQPAEWMTPLDEILAALSGTDLVLTPAVVLSTPDSVGRR